MLIYQLSSRSHHTIYIQCIICFYSFLYSCAPDGGEDRLKIRVLFTTSATHTFSELQTMFMDAVQDGRVGLLDVVSDSSMFEHAGECLRSASRYDGKK